MNRLGRVSLKSPQMVMINFADNPSAIKAARVALQKSSLAVNPQQEGIVLYVPVQRMTRERREELVNAAKTKILHDYKEALNKVCLYICIFYKYVISRFIRSTTRNLQRNPRLQIWLSKLEICFYQQNGHWRHVVLKRLLPSKKR